MPLCPIENALTFLLISIKLATVSRAISVDSEAVPVHLVAQPGPFILGHNTILVDFS
jgi:hypothetical protein